MSGRNIVRLIAYVPPGLAAIALAVAAWLWYTETGTRLLMEQLIARVPGVHYESLSGTVATRIKVTGLTYDSKALTVEVHDTSLAIDGYALLGGRIRLTRIDLDTVDVAWRNIEPEPQAEAAPIRVPLPINLGLAAIRNVAITIDGGEPVAIDEFTGLVTLRNDTVSIDIDRIRQRDIAVAGRLTWVLNPPLDISGRLRTLGPQTVGGQNVDAHGTFEVRSDSTIVNADVSSLIPVNVRAQIGYDRRADIRLTTEPGRLHARVNFDFADGITIDAALDGNLYGRALSGNVALNRRNGSLAGRLDLVQEQNRLTATLDGTELEFSSQLPQLALAWPDLAGSAAVDGTLDYDSGELKVNAATDDVAYADISAHHIGAKVHGNFKERLEANVQATGIASGDTAIGDANATWSGTASAGELTVDWHRQTISANASTHATIDGSTVLLDVDSAHLAVAESRWQLSAPTRVRLDQALVIDDSCWQPSSEGASGTVCLNNVRLRDGGVSTDVVVRQFSMGGAALPSATGRVGFASGNLDVSVAAPAIDLDGPVQFSQVELTARGPADRLALEATASLDAQGQSPTALAIDAELAGSTLVFDRISLRRDDADITAQGQFDLERRSLQAGLDGNLMQRRVTGDANLTLATPLAGTANLSVGSDATLTLSIDGTRLDARLDVASLTALMPDAFGSVQAEVTANLEQRTWTAWLDARDIDARDVSIASMTATGSGTGTEQLNTSLGFGRLDFGGMYVGNGILAARGDRASLDIDTQLIGDTWRLVTASTLAWQGGSISGRLRGGTLDAVRRQWQLSAPVEFSIDDRLGQVAPHCWQGPASHLCVDSARFDEQSASLKATLRDAPIALRGFPWAPEVRVDGKMNMDVDVSASAPFGSANTNASAKLTIPALAIHYFDEETMMWRFDGTLDIKSGRLQSRLSGESGSENNLRITARMPDIAMPGRFTASTVARTDTLGVITALIPALDRAQGIVNVDATVNTLDNNPVADINAVVEEGASVVVPAAGIEFKDIAFFARGDASRIALSLSGRSGDGTVEANGSIDSPLSSDRAVEVSVIADRLRAIEREDMALVASSNLDMSYEGPGTASLRGSITVNDGKFTTQGLTAPTRSVSPDVVVVSRRPSPSPLGQLDLQLDVGIDAFTVDLYGLEGGIEGNVTISQRPASARRAVGNVTLVDGTFERYGQTFDVERGRLIFGGPLMNPIIDVVSIREIKETDRTVRVTLSLSGPADNIRSSISASPTMSEAQALSYLMLGRPLGASNQSEEEALSGAAIALGLRQARGLTEDLRESLGLEELTISSSGFDSTSVIAGKRLSDDLYVEYSYDIMGRLGGIMVEYRLSDRLSLQTRSGEEQSMRLVYSIN